MKRVVGTLICVALMASTCGCKYLSEPSTAARCWSPETKNTVKALFLNGIKTRIADEIHNTASPNKQLTPAQVTALQAGITVELSDFFAKSADRNMDSFTCGVSGIASMKLPNGITATSISRTVEFSIYPTEDGKHLYVIPQLPLGEALIEALNAKLVNPS